MTPNIQDYEAFNQIMHFTHIDRGLKIGRERKSGRDNENRQGAER